MYTSKDFSFILVTYNRAKYIKNNLEHLIKLKSKPFEIVVVDQSENEETKKICNEFKKKLPIVYIKSKIPSIAKAKNLGVSKCSKKTKVLLFLDDDAYVGEEYLDQIVYWYNKLNPNGIFGFSFEKMEGFIPDTFFKRIKFNLRKLIKRFFFLGYIGDSEFRVTSPFGNNSTGKITGPVRAMWFPGTDPSFKKEILMDLKFDENFFWWSLGEDIDIGYRVYKKYGELYVVPADISHKHPKQEDDLTKTIKKIYMNQINHFYLYYKLMPEMKFKFAWSLIGISLIRFLSLFNFRRKTANYEFKHFVKSLIYSYKNREKIKKGDISIPYG